MITRRAGSPTIDLILEPKVLSAIAVDVAVNIREINAHFAAAQGVSTFSQPSASFLI